ncbi:MAG: ROK family transcriptional regulator, partial [Bacteroidia bacterium]|nr:ROK family transcriptional regulator [Bacteroidia bacterium]
MKNTFLQQSYDGNKTASLKKELIRLLVLNGNYSITDLSREVNISVPTMTKLIGELITEGFVLDFGKQGTSGGRRPNMYGLNPDAGYFIGVDINKDNISLGLINFKGQLIEYEPDKPFVLENTIHSLDKLCAIIKSFITRVTVSKEKILAVGVNLSGRVNSQSGFSYSFYYLDEKPLSA